MAFGPDPSAGRVPVVLALVVLAGGAALGFGLLGGGDQDAHANENTIGARTGEDPAAETPETTSVPVTSDAAFFGSGEEDKATEIDEEEALRVLELEAEVAYGRIPSEATREDRIAELEASDGIYP